MVSNLASNLKFLRKTKGLTQQQFADEMKVKRSLIGSYEEDRADPKYELLHKMAEFFNLSIDEMIHDEIDEFWKPKSTTKGENLRILSITTDNQERENIELVPVKASAGYLNGFEDPQYISELPKFQLPIPALKQGTFRAFELNGDSMLPLQHGTIIIAEYVENWNDVKTNETYVIISKSEGLVYKRLGSKFKENKSIKLVSDNKIYEPYHINSDDILEIWKAKAYISTHLPEADAHASMEQLSTMMAQMQRTINQMQQKNTD